MKFFGDTDVGLVRTNNEDSFYVKEDNHVGCFIVADGMGGHNAGEVASKIAIDTISMEMDVAIALNSNITESLRAAVKSASTKIYRHAQSGEGLSGMGTTVDACVIRDRVAYIAHVGDSRVYVLQNNKLYQVTIDHSLVEEMVQSKQITAEEALVHPMRNIITRALGEPSVLVDIIELELGEHDRLLLCSDGLSGMLSTDELAAIMLGDTPQGIVEEMIEKAKSNGGEDNITAVVIFMETEDAS